MNSLQKLRTPYLLKWVSSMVGENASKSSKLNHLYVNGACPVRFFSTATVVVESKNVRNLAEVVKRSAAAKKEAQAAILDYLHSTRGLEYRDALSMSKPKYYEKVLEGVEIEDGDIGKAVKRFLRYYPVNEFEPFFESIGLKPSEYLSLIPQRLVYLCDDELLLENYYVLCNYGIPRNMIGKFFKEVREIFGYDHGVLSKKLRSFEELGLSQSLVAKIVVSSPCLLRGSANMEFVKALEKLAQAGVQNVWLEQHISEGDSYDGKVILEIILLLRKTGLNDKQLGEFIMQHHGVLHEQSGRAVLHLFGFLSKFGFTQDGIKNVFIELPDMSILRFVSNLCRHYEFLVKINMNHEDIGKIVREHLIMLGSCQPKAFKTLCCELNCGAKRLCQMVLDNPNVLNDLVYGVKINRLPGPNQHENSRMLKIKFLVNLGFIENSREMEKAFRACKCIGLELQERFDCLVDLGLSRDEVIRMVQLYPQIINQSKAVLVMKITSFVALGYSMYDLLTYPQITYYTTERVKLRLLFCQWLRVEKVLHRKPKFSTLLASSEKTFTREYVKRHPRGLDYYNKLKKEIYSESHH